MTSFAENVDRWAESGYDELMLTARTYNAVINYDELAHHVQDRTGLRTSMLMMNWIGKVLERVARRCADGHEPPLTSLCVHKDGTIGDGYAKAAAMSGVTNIDDIELLAANDRLRCYQAYAKDLPADGGRPALTPQVEERRARRNHSTPPPQAKLCPTCWTALPRSGVCGYCS